MKLYNVLIIKTLIFRLREEIDHVLGEKTFITYEDLSELKYCNAVFKETLRLWPPVQRLNRICPDEMVINGLKIPPNTIFSVYFKSFKILSFIFNFFSFQLIQWQEMRVYLIIFTNSDRNDFLEMTLKILSNFII